MKTRFVRLFALYMVITLLFSSVAIAECIHDWDWLYDPVNNYEVVDDDYHKIVSTTLYYICENCGQEKIDTQDASEQFKSNHYFNDSDICYTCGYEREKEVHEHDWEFEYDPEYDYEVVDEDYHEIVSVTLYYYCTDCGETKIEVDDSVYSKNEHNFKNNVCGTCGYEKEIHEHDWEFEYDPEYDYEVVDEDYHEIVSVTLYYYCTDCGETKTEVDDSVYSKNEHNFKNNVCGTCGYKKEIVVTATPTVVPTATQTVVLTTTPTAVPTATPTAVPTATLTAIPTATPTAVPTATLTAVPTATPTVVPTAMPTAVPAATPTVVPTAMPTAVPAATPTVVSTVTPTAHLCTYKDSHWYQNFEYYNEEKHSFRHVITKTCTECGKSEKTNNLEYADHKFENNVCIKCKHQKPLASAEDIEYATKRMEELNTILGLIKRAMENGDIVDSDAFSEIEKIALKYYNYSEVKSGTRSISTIQESEKIDIDNGLKAEKLILTSDYGRKVAASQAIAYYQIVNGLEVTGWITAETYNYVLKTEAVRENLSRYMSDMEKLSAEKLVDLIGKGIQFIQENKENEEVCDSAYMQIEVLVKYLKQTPEYLSNRNLKDVDWIFHVDEDTPGFKDIVDLAFTKDNIYSNATGTLAEEYLDQYNQQYVANTLTVIDGVLIISVGGAIAYEAITTGGVVLTIGTTVVPVAGDTATQWEQAVHHTIQSVNSNSAHHMLQEKHLWSNLVSNPTWGNISGYIENTLLYGNYVQLGSWSGKEMLINGNLIRVKYIIDNGVLIISNAYINSN